MIVENDCEDQGFSLIEDGCLRFQCQTWDGNKPAHPKLVKVRHHGKTWWECPTCHYSYGEALYRRCSK